MCVVIDLDAVCLICLQPSKEMHQIFSTDEDDPELLISQKIAILSELKTNQSNPTLPSKICKKCLQDLKAAWRFRKNCQAAVTIFQTIVKLDDVKPGSLNKNEISNQIKVPQGLQIKRIGSENKDAKNEHLKKSRMDEIINDDKVGSTMYNELESNCLKEIRGRENHEFQQLQEDSENYEQNEFENNDENSFVEYYITDDGAMDDHSTKSDENSFIKENNKEEQPKVQKEAVGIEENKSTKIYIENTYNKQQSRGRPRKQNLSVNTAKNLNLVQAEINGTLIINNPSSNEEQIQTVREVKTRKRKSRSPETKTPKICEICGNSYRFQHALNAHMRRHFNDKPFPCECCDKAFVSNVELRRHMRVHTGQKPYSCQYCERRFSDFGSRIKHERTHTGERPYHCVTCGKSFAYPHVLSVHLRTHTGEKRFRCEYCSKGFTKKAYLISHVKHHSNFQNLDDDTVDKSQSNLKSEALEECVYTEFSNEVIDEVEEYDENSFQDGEIINHTIMEPKIEDNDDTEIHEIVDESDEFIITVR